MGGPLQMARRVTRGAAPRLAGALLLTALLAGCSPKTETKTNDLDAALPKTTTLSVQTVTARAGTLTAQRTRARPFMPSATARWRPSPPAPCRAFP
ncbi:hypothetical protein [Deinococcus radiodurans]|uniref:hypothetical protein n=1 Tax=Deinococcus radiodurans TaxID=1299 RepID=UPI001F1E72A1|nr:hypothetical protein [Deinococcus radiodurans]